MTGAKTIYSRDGTPIADIKTAVARSSLLNDCGEATFYIPTTSVKCRRELLEFGNYLYIQNTDLPDWVGIIDTPRVWHNHYVEIRAYEVPFILKYRTTPMNSVLIGTPGELVVQLLNIANMAEDTLLRPGNIFTGGTSTTETLTESVYSHIKAIQNQTGHNWICTPNIDEFNKLTISLDWIERNATTTVDLEISQGHNVVYGDTPLTEGGELFNKVNVINDQQNVTALSITRQDNNAIARYGLREGRIQFQTLGESGALIAAGDNFISTFVDPEIATPISIVDVGDSYKKIRLGNIVRYRYTNVGFDADGLGGSGDVVINGFFFDETTNVCEIYTGKML